MLMVCTVPVNVKGEDVFHLTIEEYLLALVSVIDELVCSVHQLDVFKLLMMV